MCLLPNPAEHCKEAAEHELWHLSPGSLQSCTAHDLALQLGFALLQETKLLQTIDQLRGQAHIVLQAERTGHKLQTMAQPKQWPVSNGHSVEVDTPFTTRWGPALLD